MIQRAIFKIGFWDSQLSRFNSSIVSPIEWDFIDKMKAVHHGTQMVYM